MSKTIKNLRKQGFTSPETPSKRSRSAKSTDTSSTSSQQSGNGTPKDAKNMQAPHARGSADHGQGARLAAFEFKHDR